MDIMFILNTAQFVLTLILIFLVGGSIISWARKELKKMQEEEDDQHKWFR